MKNYIIPLIALCIFCIGFDMIQTKFEEGFDDGYESGYCYQEPNCVAPSPPSAPTPNVNESRNSYKDGYNRGFTKGRSDSRE